MVYLQFVFQMFELIEKCAPRVMSGGASGVGNGLAAPKDTRATSGEAIPNCPSVPVYLIPASPTACRCTPQPNWPAQPSPRKPHVEFGPFGEPESPGHIVDKFASYATAHGKLSTWTRFAWCCETYDWIDPRAHFINHPVGRLRRRRDVAEPHGFWSVTRRFVAPLQSVFDDGRRRYRPTACVRHDHQRLCCLWRTTLLMYVRWKLHEQPKLSGIAGL